MDTPYTPEFKFIDYWGKVSEKYEKVNKDIAEKHVRQILQSLENNCKYSNNKIVTAITGEQQMLNVQKYLIENGIEKLKSEFKIKVREYEDRIVLNYDQIESVQFHPIVDECRNLILSKDFEVISQSFQRFYNYLEGVQTSQNDIPLKFRISSNKEIVVKDFSIDEAEFYNKVDGSLINFYNYKNQWNISTRSTAFGEGESNMGRTFAEVFKSAKEYPNLIKTVTNYSQFNNLTMIFELTSPESRVVVPFSETRIFLIGARDRNTGKELISSELDALSLTIGVERPQRYQFATMDELVKWVKEQGWTTEGIVLVIDRDGSHDRIKIKNPTHLAIAHMRNNGKLSLKRVLAVILANEQSEYLQYFAMDKVYFDFVEQELNLAKEDLTNVWNQCKDIENQKEFALKMMPMVKYKFETGILFSAKKTKEDPISLLLKSESDKLVEGLGLKEKFVKVFNKSDEGEDV